MADRGTGWIRVKLTGGMKKETQLIITNMAEGRHRGTGWIRVKLTGAWYIGDLALHNKQGRGAG
jgi:hypothetical protein